MSSVYNSYPVAISRLSSDGDSRELQNRRAIEWLLEQPGGPIVVITANKSFDSHSVKRLIARPGVIHRTWKGLSGSSFSGQRVLHAWPDRQRLNDLWDTEADALAVIEWAPEKPKTESIASTQFSFMPPRQSTLLSITTTCKLAAHYLMESKSFLSI